MFFVTCNFIISLLNYFDKTKKPEAKNWATFLKTLP